MDDHPIQIRVAVAWGDMDAFQHVNNTVYFRWFESVRIECFRQVGWIDAQARTGVGPILARTQCVYRKPITFPDTVLVGARIEDLGEDRFTMRYRIDSERLGPEAALGEARIVAFDYGAGTKAPIPADVHAALAKLAASASSARSPEDPSGGAGDRQFGSSFQARSNSGWAWCR